MNELLVVNSEKKTKGRIYTPLFLVKNILDLIGYQGEVILQKHVIDNSCGDGAFLQEVVARYCEAYVNLHKHNRGLKEELSTYIHGIELDATEIILCQEKLQQKIKEYHLLPIEWDLLCGDTLCLFEKYQNKMDFVVGNPPYVRVHNLETSYANVKKFSFAQKGMTDLFLVFYEIGLQMLNSTGKLGYITPSSFYNSVAGRDFRHYLQQNEKISKIVDLKHFQPFAALTYTTIVILEQQPPQQIEYYVYDEKTCQPILRDIFAPAEFYFAETFYLGTKSEIELIKEIKFAVKQTGIQVKNGFATLKDDFFINQSGFPFYEIPVVKASTGEWKKCFFPYRDGKIISWQEIGRNKPLADFLLENKASLQNRALEKETAWYGFGRSQGINTVGFDKLSVSAFFHPLKEPKVNFCPAGTGIYSGYSVLTRSSETEVKTWLSSDLFRTYVQILGKYKSQGYYTFSAQELKDFLNYCEQNKKK